MSVSDIRINWKMLLLCFVLACALWYTVTVRDRLEVQAEVALSYRGMPENLMIRDGLPKSFTLQLRSPRALARSLDTRTLTHSVDLSVLRRGTNVIALSAPRIVAESRAIDVVWIVPNQLVLEAEAILERTVFLEPRFSAPALAQALKAGNLHVMPDSVSLRGPESVIREIAGLKLDVPLEPADTGDYQLSLPVSTPPQVTAAPISVLVSYSVGAKRVLAELERVPFVDAKNPPPYRITPQKVALTVEVPEWLMDDKSYLEKIRVVIDVKDLPLSGSGELMPAVRLPEGARLVEISPAKLEVTKR